MTDFQNTTPGSSNSRTDQAKQEAGQLGREAKGQAAEVKDTAVSAASQVADTAKQEATQVVGEAREQVRGLIDTTLGEVRGRTREGQGALASTLKGLTDELGKMTSGQSTSGPVAEFAGDLAQRGDRLASWLENAEPDDILGEVRRFAARRPGTFLAVAAGAGLLAGRLARGTREVIADENQRAEALQHRTGNTQYAGTTQYTGTTQYRDNLLGEPTGYVQPAGYPQTGTPSATPRTTGTQPTDTGLGNADLNADILHPDTRTNPGII